MSESNVPYINEINMIEIKRFLMSLGKTPFDLSEKHCKKIYDLFPIPKDHKIIWADCEFDLRCSGIVCTTKGLFIKSNVKALDEKIKKNQKENEGKSILYYFKWENFSPSYFVGGDKNNFALTVDPKCQSIFLQVCENFHLKYEEKKKELRRVETTEYNSYVGVVTGVTAGVAGMPNANTEFIDQYIRNVNGRHGFFAEQANNMYDTALGRNAEVVGAERVNGRIPKSGEDRLIKHILARNEFIQTKYCKTASDTLKAGFGSDGYYKYVNEEAGIMQFEVPKDQYHDIVKLFEDKIRAGKVVDANGNVIKDPKQASKIVREGHYTYEQTVKMAEPGNIEAIKYDIRTGMVTCMYAFGISCLLTMIISYRRHKDLRKAIDDGIKAGVKVFGLTMFNHVLISQLYRTKYFQNFTGNVVLRDTLVTSGATFLIYSIPDIINVLSNNISFGQFVKNTIVLGASIAGGAGGSALGGEIGEAIAGKAGRLVGSLLGGIGGGIAGAVASKTATDVVRENDVQIFSRLFNAVISSLVIDYVLDDSEIDKLSKKLERINESEMKKLMKNFRKIDRQEKLIVEFVEPYFKEVARERARFKEPKLLDLATASI